MSTCPALSSMSPPPVLCASHLYGPVEARVPLESGGRLACAVSDCNAEVSDQSHMQKSEGHSRSMRPCGDLSGPVHAPDWVRAGG